MNFPRPKSSARQSESFTQFAVPAGNPGVRLNGNLSTPPTALCKCPSCTEMMERSSSRTGLQGQLPRLTRYSQQQNNASYNSAANAWANPSPSQTKLESKGQLEPEIGAGDNRRWLFNSPSQMNGVSVGIPSPKMHLDPIKVHPKAAPRGNAPSYKTNAPALSMNGLGCDIMSQINEITDGVYLCGARAMKGQRLLDMGITNVVNVTVELPCLNIDEIETMKIALDDSPYSNLSYYFDRVADKIEEVRKSGGRTVVHCVAGVSRSASLVIVYLMKYKKMSLRQAYSFVKARRPIIRPNVGFFRQLAEYESRLFGSSSVKMVWNAAAGGYIPDVYEPEYNNTLAFLKKYGLQTDRLGRCGYRR